MSQLHLPIRRVALFLLAALLVIMGVAGCLPPCSLHPFYQEAQVEFDPSLVGDWAYSDTTSDGWTIEKLGERWYAVSITSAKLPRDSVTCSIGTPFRLDGLTLLDLAPGEVPERFESRYAPFPLISGHTLVLVEQRAESLRVSFLADGWWRSRLEENPKLLRHEIVESPGIDEEDHLVLTATTEEIQRFLVKELRRDSGALDRIFYRRDAWLGRRQTGR